jgi:hypothetical protein
MRNSGVPTILKWANNKNNNKLTNGSGKNGDKSANKNWIHSPETLLNGHVVYLVKFLGDIEVDQPKGIEVVKQGVQKLKFNQQLKKAESGSGSTKMPKMELTISVNGVTIQEPKSKKVMHEYPLHRISYCADDKEEKRFFSFIAKDEHSNKHTCFVFLSDKLAEDITLTIGQAFDLAYKKFLESKGKELESQKQSLIMQKRIEILEHENKELKKRLAEVAKIKGQNDVQQYLKENNIAELCTVEPILASTPKVSTSEENEDKLDNGSSTNNSGSAETIQTQNKTENSLICLDDQKLDFGLTMDNFTLEDIQDDDFDPRALDSSPVQVTMPIAQVVAPVTPVPPVVPIAHVTPVLAPPPALPPRDAQKTPENNNNPFMDSDPFGPSKDPSDPFGMATFTSPAPNAIKPSLPSNPLASLDDLDPFKNL